MVWGPPPAFHLVRDQPVSPGSPVPANQTGPAVPAAPPAPSAGTAPTAKALATADFDRRVVESQKMAVAVYPALANPNSNLNVRFVACYQRWQAGHSPRLQDPDWPMQLAVESAAAAGVPAMQTARVPASRAAAPAPAAPVSTPPVAAGAVSRVNMAVQVPVAPFVSPPAVATAGHSATRPTAAPAVSPEGGVAPLISLNVSSMNAGSTYNVHWLTSYYGYDILGKTSKALDLDARNLSAHAAQVALQWIFTVHKNRRGDRAIFDMGSGNWDMQPNQSTHLGVRSADLNTRTTWYCDYGYGRYYGSEFDGWLVIARYKDKVLKVVGSSGTLESLVGTPEFATLVSAYQSAHPGGAGTPPGNISAR